MASNSPSFPKSSSNIRLEILKHELERLFHLSLLILFSFLGFIEILRLIFEDFESNYGCEDSLPPCFGANLDFWVTLLFQFNNVCVIKFR